MKKTFSVATRKNTLYVEALDKLTVKSVVRDGRERVYPTDVSLPKAYEKNGERKDFAWKLSSVENMDGAISAVHTDESCECVFTVNIKARADVDGAFEYSTRLENKGKGEVRIFPDKLFCLGYAFDSTPSAWRFMKESGVAENMPWSKGVNFFPGTGIYKDVLKKGESVLSWTTTNQDFNSGGMIPMVYLDAATYGAYIGVEWTSERIFCEGTDDGAYVCVDYGEGFTTLLPEGESFTVAPIYVGFYDGDVDDGSNLFKRWFFLEKTPKNVLYNENEPIVQEDAFRQLAPKDAAECGIGCLKWDYGWWSNDAIENPPTLWKYNEGSWKLRADFAKDHLKTLGFTSLADYGKHLKELGLEWTVYLLLHDCLCETDEDDLLTSVGKNAHPEWFTDRRIAGICPTADLGNKDCVEYCKRKLYEFLKENNASGWRTDFEPIAQSSDKKNRHDANGNDVQYWCSRGFYEIVDYLIETLPGFRYESCSSGGSMKDFATFCRATVFNTDDSADFVSLRTTFYDSSYCFPPSQLQLPLDVDTFIPESVGYSGYFNKEFGFRHIIAAAVMAGSHTGVMPDGKLPYGVCEYYKKYYALHNEIIKPLIRHANLYHILPRPDNVNWDGIQYGTDTVPANGICGAAFVFKPTAEGGDVKRIYPRGLAGDVKYKVCFYERGEQDFEAMGAELMEDGFDVVMTEPCASDIIFFKA